MFIISLSASGLGIFQEMFLVMCSMFWYCIVFRAGMEIDLLAARLHGSAGATSSCWPFWFLPWRSSSSVPLVFHLIILYITHVTYFGTHSFCCSILFHDSPFEDLPSYLMFHRFLSSFVNAPPFFSQFASRSSVNVYTVEPP